jgi:thiol-disulfide isomerase/thioredoxin
MDIRKIVLLGSGLLIGAALGLWILWGGPFKADSASRKMPEIGLQSSDFSLEDLSGKQITLSSLQGKAVILNFWATWCPPCKEEMPLLQDYARRYPDRLVVVGVDYQEDQRDVAAFVHDLDIQFPIVLDNQGSVANQYFVRSFPTTFFIDSSGVLRAQHIGQLDAALVDEYLAKVGISP